MGAAIREPMPVGFEIQLSQVSLARRCIHVRSCEPLRRQVEALDSEIVY